MGKSIYHNPNGIWVSCGLSWIDYASHWKYNQWCISTYVYEITLDDTILKISTVEELKKFINHYKKDNMKIYDVIDWKKVRKELSGLVICPYLGNKIWGKRANKFGIYGPENKTQQYIEKLVGNKWKNDIFFTAEWYRHWEAGTGIIWSNNAIKEVRLIKKLNTFDNVLTK